VRISTGRQQLNNHSNHGGGQTLGAVPDFQLDFLALFQRAEAFRLNYGMMDEDIALVGLDKTKPLGIIEPPDLTFHHSIISFKNKHMLGAESETLRMIPKDP
jgi:hypothetical protein